MPSATRSPIGRPLHNAVALLRDGKIVSRHFKTLVADVRRVRRKPLFRARPGRLSETNSSRSAQEPVGLSICEDLWNDEKFVTRRLYHQNPIADLNAAGAKLMINASASPFVEGKPDFRLKLFGGQAKEFGRPLIVVNQVGGNDELVFDGNSVAFDANGNVIARGKAFEEDLVFVDVSSRGLGVPPEHSRGAASPQALGQDAQATKSIYQALILGLRDYVRKCGFQSVVLGLSGGIDSA